MHFDITFIAVIESPFDPRSQPILSLTCDDCLPYTHTKMHDLTKMKKSLIQFLLLLCLPILHKSAGPAHIAHFKMAGDIFNGLHQSHPPVMLDPHSSATRQGSEKLKAIELDEDDDTDRKHAGDGRNYFCSYYEPETDVVDLHLCARFSAGRRIPRYTSPHYIIHQVLRI